MTDLSFICCFKDTRLLSLTMTMYKISMSAERPCLHTTQTVCGAHHITSADPSEVVQIVGAKDRRLDHANHQSEYI